jgi:hypothetical protein
MRGSLQGSIGGRLLGTSSAANVAPIATATYGRPRLFYASPGRLATSSWPASTMRPSRVPTHRDPSRLCRHDGADRRQRREYQPSSQHSAMSPEPARPTRPKLSAGWRPADDAREPDRSRPRAAREDAIDPGRFGTMSSGERAIVTIAMDRIDDLLRGGRVTQPWSRLRTLIGPEWVTAISADKSRCP